MAANDYFNAHSNDQKPSSSQYLHEPTVYTTPAYSQSPYTTQSPYLSPIQSHDSRLGDGRIPTYHAASPLEASTSYQDQIPLQQTGKIKTDPEWQSTSNQYPPSPADQQAPLNPSQPPRRKRRSKKKKGFFAGPIPWVVYTMSLVQLVVFIVEIVRNAQLTGSPIMTRPSFNPMIGPSTYVLINMGARFVPCMRTTPGVQDSAEPITWPCPNSTTLDATSPLNKCTLTELCGFGNNLDEQHPNQWWRFIVPIFLHAGLIHIGFNMLLQLTMGREIERIIGSIRFFLVYVSSGIFGFVLGGNFAATAIASTGASGSLFGILAIVLLDLLYSWRERVKPVRDLLWILFDIVISLVLGLLPGLDNFSHIGGFVMGLVAGICILHSPSFLRQRIGEVEPYRNIASETDISMSGGLMSSGSNRSGDKHKQSRNDDLSSPISVVGAGAGAAPTSATATFVRRPIGFFKGRKPLWWVWWLVRVGALLGVSIGFVFLLMNFYRFRSTCSWCKYLSCLPINNWCELGNLTFRSTNQKRSLIEAGARVMGVTMSR